MLHTAKTRETPGSGEVRQAPAIPAARISEKPLDDPNRTIPSMPLSHESRMNRIARRAHEIYEARGGQDGKALDDWLQAEREVDAEMESSRGAEE
jgi:Protein of unknown function (DUF2934)